MITSPKDVQQELVSASQPVYASAPVDEDAIAKLLHVYTNRHRDLMEFGHLELAGEEDYLVL